MAVIEQTGAGGIPRSISTYPTIKELRRPLGLVTTTKRGRTENGKSRHVGLWK